MPQQALGSGFVIDKTGHIVTNYHVIEGADEIEVSFSNQDTLSATIVGSDPSTDIAVLRVQSSSRGLAPLAFGNSDTVRVGDSGRRDRQPVRAPPDGDGRHRQRRPGADDHGAERLSDRPRDPDRRADQQRQLGRAAPERPRRGDRRQLADRPRDGSTGNVGIGFAVPSNTVKEVVAQLVATGKVDRAYLGISGSTITAELARVFRLPVDEGVLVEDVSPRSAAAKAG